MKPHSKIIFGKKPYHPRDPKVEAKKLGWMETRYFPHESQAFIQVNRDLNGQLSENLSRLNSQKDKRPLVVDLGCGTAVTAAEAAAEGEAPAEEAAPEEKKE